MRHLTWLSFAAALFTGLAAFTGGAAAQSASIAAKKPLFAGACVHCPWGEVAEIMREAMKPAGYDVQICYNCNRVDSPLFVSQARVAPPIGEHERELGVTTRPEGKMDFGATDALRLKWAYEGLYDYKTHGPQKNLRLIAKIEDPYFLIVAVKKESGITDLKDIIAKKMKVRVVSEGMAITKPIMDYYGLSKEALEAQGGSTGFSMARPKPDFDVLITFLGTLSNNPESSIWYEATQKHDLHFLELPADLRAQMAKEFGLEPVEIPYGYMKGVDRRIPALGYSGQLVIARDDTPDSFAYDAAKALDERRDLLKWRLRPFSYDTRTVWKNYEMPLHPGAERYYREVGYMK